MRPQAPQLEQSTPARVGRRIGILKDLTWKAANQLIDFRNRAAAARQNYEMLNPPSKFYLQLNH